MVMMFVGGVVLMLDGFLQIIKSRMSQIRKRCGHFQNTLPVTKRITTSRCVFYVLGSSCDN